jgi:ParB family transcriptional regulator, chromosome partitioning protein
MTRRSDQRAKLEEAVFTEADSGSRHRDTETRRVALTPIADMVKDVRESTAEENDRLKRELESAITSGRLVVELDPTDLVETRFRDRDERGFIDDDFAELVLSIKNEGQRQPIEVRKSKEEVGKYDVVFGHRRARACRTLGIKVRAIVVDVSDLELVIRMDAENAKRANLSPIENARKYRLWIEIGLMTHQDIAERIGKDRSVVTKILGLNEIPGDILSVFEDPRQISLREGTKLVAALRRPGVLEHARTEAPRLKEESLSVNTKIAILCSGRKQAAPTRVSIGTCTDKQGRVRAEMQRVGENTVLTLTEGMPPAVIEAIWALMQPLVDADSERLRDAANALCAAAAG